MHRRLGEVEKLLSNWCTTTYGQHWLKVARHPGHMLRLLVGKGVPSLTASHVVASVGVFHTLPGQCPSEIGQLTEQLSIVMWRVGHNSHHFREPL